VSFDLRRLATYVTSKPDVKAAERTLVVVRSPCRLKGHIRISMTARYPHLSRTHPDAAVDRLNR
jgi:hypothetical protein